MAKVETRRNPARASEEGLRSDAGEIARKRLLAELPVTERRLKLNGVPTLVLEGGDGPPIVLLHGPGEYGAKWLRVIPNLIKTHRVIAPDLPGHGMTGMFEGPLQATRMLAWLDDLIECTCPVPPTLVGHVLGGAVAARFAAEHADRLGRLVLVDALGLTAFQPTPSFAAAMTEFLSNPTGETHDRMWSRCAYDLDAMRNNIGEPWKWIKTYNLDRAWAPGLAAAQHGLMSLFGFPAIPPVDLARIAVPTSLIWGRHDLATQLSVAQRVGMRHGWPLYVIENAGDDPPMEQPEAFLEALRAILQSPEPGGKAANVQDTRAAWDRIAEGYDKTNTPTQMWIAGEGLRRAGVRPEMQFLDVAAGSGALSIPAARLGARAVATDQSSAMLELLAARARKEGLDIETRAMDGHALAFEDDSFDMAGSQFGVMLFPDMPRGIREMRRVVRPGGRVLLHAYGDPHEIEFLGFLVRAVQSVRPEFNGPPMDPPPLEFQLADPDRLRKEFVTAGLRNVVVETVTETTEHKTGEALWEWLIWSNPIVESVLGTLNLTTDERATIRQALEDMVRERAGGTGAAKLTNPVNIAIGTK